MAENVMHQSQNQNIETNQKSKAPNSKRRFGFLISDFGFPRRGITLLLVVLILSSLLSISIGIFASIFGELRLSGQIGDSFIALYAADQGIEWGLYTDRNQPTPFCKGTEGPNCYDSGNVALPNGSCYRLRVDKTATGQANTFNVELRSTGEYRCGAGASAVKRALLTTYSATYR